MSIDHFPTQGYEGKVHGELITDGNASALTVINLYKSGSTVTISALGAKDRLYITEVTILLEDGGDFALVADSAAAGLYIAEGNAAANGGLHMSARQPYCCPAGVIPKFKGAAANKSTCIIEGFISSA